MKPQPAVNYGVVATNVSAKSLAVGPGATATNTEQTAESAINAALGELKLLLAELHRSHPDLPEAKVAQSLLTTVDAAVASKDEQSFSDSVQSIVSIFKAIGDTVSTSQKIVDVAQNILSAL